MQSLVLCSTAREPCTVSALYAFVTKWHHFVLEISSIVKNPACVVCADLVNLHLCPELGALVLETDVVLMFGSARKSQKYNIHLAKVPSESSRASLPSRSLRQGTINPLSLSFSLILPRMPPPCPIYRLGDAASLNSAFHLEIDIFCVPHQ